MANHGFTDAIIAILEKNFNVLAEEILEKSPLLGYLNIKTKSANSGSKARGAFANHYALYVLIEDYIAHGYHASGPRIKYSKYEGARFSDLLRRQRELPFGAKLQNHALNARLNDEFRRYYPTLGVAPVIRDVESQRYWIQEDLLLVDVRNDKGQRVVKNIAESVIEIIDAYVKMKMAAFKDFLATCRQMSELEGEGLAEASAFVLHQLKPNVDARIFEIVSFSILRAKFGNESIWIGSTKENVAEEILRLYKTGRTNANDGGIDFVMQPLGRFFQVTETIDVGKYFLDIEKVQRFPITFVVKTASKSDEVLDEIRSQAIAKYKIQAVVDNYMMAVEEIITVDDLARFFNEIAESGNVREVTSEILRQSKLEFNYVDADEIIDEAAKE